MASFPTSGRSRWHVSESSQSNNSSLSSSSFDYLEDDPIRPKSFFPATVSPIFFSNQSAKNSSEDLNLEGVPFPPGDYWLVAWAIVDQKYGEKGQGEPRYMNPQSHVSQARTNGSWYKENLKTSIFKGRKSASIDKAVKGSRYWPSDPIHVRVGQGGSCAILSIVHHCAFWRRQHYFA